LTSVVFVTCRAVALRIGLVWFSGWWQCWLRADPAVSCRLAVHGWLQFCYFAKRGDH